jgi:hypothetical protein
LDRVVASGDYVSREFDQFSGVAVFVSDFF